MKILIILGLIFTLAVVDAQASMIILKDGRVISDEIVQQDQEKVVVKDEDSFLTYYKEDIASIDGEPVGAKDDVIKADPQKEELTRQFLNFVSMREIISNWVNRNIPSVQQRVALSSLNDDTVISALDQLRKQGAMQVFTSTDLKFGIKVFSSNEGKQFLHDFLRYHADVMMGEISLKIGQETQKAIESLKPKSSS